MSTMWIDNNIFYHT